MVQSKTNFAEKGRPNDIFKFQRVFLMIMAQWPLSTSKSSWPVKAIVRLYEVFMIVLPFHVAVLHVKSLYDLWGESIDYLSDFFTSTIIYTFCCFATIFFIVCSDKMVNLIAFLNANFRDRSAKGVTYISFHQSYNRAKYFTYIWNLSCVTGTVTWALLPFAIHERVLPLRCWYPFDENQPWVYEILYAIQFLAQIQIAFVFANGSAVYLVLVILICGQYDILFCSLKNVLHTADYFDGYKMDKLRAQQLNYEQDHEELNQYYCSSEILERLPPNKARSGVATTTDSDSNLKEAFKDCVKHHHAILNVCRVMEDFYNPYCLIKSLQITFQLCFLLFINANTTSTSLLRYISLFQYLSLTSVELLLFTYFGEVLKTQSVRVSESLMRAEWFTRSGAIKKEMLILMPNALRPVLLTSGKFYPMDIQRLKSVATAAFSFFTLLQNMKNSNRI